MPESGGSNEASDASFFTVEKEKNEVEASQASKQEMWPENEQERSVDSEREAGAPVVKFILGSRDSEGHMYI